MSARLRNTLIVAALLLLWRFFGEPLWVRNWEYFLDKRDWDKALDTVASAMPEQIAAAAAWLDLGGFWGGAFSVLAVWICLEVVYTVRRRRRSVQRSNTPAPEIDKEALAQEAEDLSAKVLALVGEHEGRIREAWIADARAARDGAKHAEAEGYLIERFAQKYWNDVQRVLNLARKVASLNSDEYWVATRRVSASDLENVAKYLAKLATDLRHPIPDIPMHSPMREAYEQSAAQNHQPNPT